ncbi:hypothetical protein EDEG_02524 [Edhazardia aedis USNM 41457]|uniref:Uncharacterized protein n=1 Tax=Edhazardia aedis (strain USNM 41457) TaxID=1003232 RepID=J9DP37_EDHAE|nr:hypothetical protein EDEG_02524 [Edhazardia aedis USNM 41457]|eukprot:EJW03097.1 hypothetical protein EDEG_02524 [Edhazardia aedis USNM 41457]
MNFKVHTREQSIILHNPKTVYELIEKNNKEALNSKYRCKDTEKCSYHNSKLVKVSMQVETLLQGYHCKFECFMYGRKKTINTLGGFWRCLYLLILPVGNILQEQENIYKQYLEDLKAKNLDNEDKDDKKAEEIKEAKEQEKKNTEKEVSKEEKYKSNIVEVRRVVKTKRRTNIKKNTDIAKIENNKKNYASETDKKNSNRKNEMVTVRDEQNNILLKSEDLTKEKKQRRKNALYYIMNFIGCYKRQ